jgi:hypothetical protein
MSYVLKLFILRPKSNGGAMRDRTADLLRAKQALSQLSYSPMSKAIILSQLRQVLRTYSSLYDDKLNDK